MLVYPYVDYNQCASKYDVIFNRVKKLPLTVYSDHVIFLEHNIKYSKVSQMNSLIQTFGFKNYEAVKLIYI
jgi:hypothetical protein